MARYLVICNRLARHVSPRTPTSERARLPGGSTSCCLHITLFIAVHVVTPFYKLQSIVVLLVAFEISHKRTDCRPTTAVARRSKRSESQGLQLTAIMAGKEATVYIIDLGSSMGQKRHGRDHTDLDWALDYVWDKITTTVCRRSFGDLVRRVLLLRGAEAGFLHGCEKKR